MLRFDSCNWNKIDSIEWTEPVSEVFPLIARWKKKGFNKLLDHGCGNGRNTFPFAENGFETHGVDISESGLEILKDKSCKNNLDIKISKGDMFALPFEKESFDAVFSYLVIHHTDTEGMKNAISEIKRILKPEGEVFLTFLPKENSRYYDPKNKRIDDNTVLFNLGNDKNIPNCFVENEKDIKKFMTGFHIENLYFVKEHTGEGIKSKYLVLARKKPE